MQNFSDFLKWYNNKDVVPTLEAMQKMIEIYHNKGIDMLKLGCTLPNLANICLHKSTDQNFYPFTDSDKNLLEKIRKDMVGGPSIVCTRKVVVEETFIRKSSYLCKSIVGIDASQLYPYSMCQPMPTGLYTRWEYDSETEREKTNPAPLRIWFCRVSNKVNQSAKYRVMFQLVDKKIECFSVDGICYHCNTVFEARGCYYHYCPCQEARPSLTDTDIERGVKKRQQDEMRRDYKQQKGYQIVEMWECEWWSLYKTNASVKSHLRKNFPNERPLSEEQLLQGIIDGRLFGYVQCDVEFPEHLRSYFSNFLPIFKNTVVSREDIGTLMREYAEKGNIMAQPRKMLISSFNLTDGTIITPLLLFYLKLVLVCKKIHRFVQYTPRKCFNNFVQSAVDARGQGDENPNSSVVTETMKLLASSSYGYQIRDCSRHTVTKYLNDEKTHSAINSKMFKRPNHNADQLYEIEHREPIIVGFFILQYAKQRMLELYYNFFKKFCDTDKYEELEMDTDSLYLALSEENLKDVILPEKRAEWVQLRSKDCTDNFTGNATDNFFPGTCCFAHKKHDKREPGLFKEEFRCAEMLCLFSKTYCCYDKRTNKCMFSSKGLNKRTLEECGDGGPMSKYLKVLEEAVTLLQSIEDFERFSTVLLRMNRQRKDCLTFILKE